MKGREQQTFGGWIMKGIIRLHYVQGWQGLEPFWTVNVKGNTIPQDFTSEAEAIAAAVAAGVKPKNIVHLDGGRPR
jgi:hypothetical protein